MPTVNTTRIYKFLHRLTSKDWFWRAVVLSFGLAVMMFDFTVMGLYQVNGDTPDYLDTITYFSGKNDYYMLDGLDVFYIRLLKPFYGVACSFLTPILTPQQAMLLLNVTFYFGTILLLFKILKNLINLRTPLAALGSMWFACSYPILKNGFSLLTDVSGYFFIALTSYWGLQGFKQKKLIWFALAGAAAGFGGLCKETGTLGLLFVVTYCFFDYKNLGWKKILTILSITVGSFIAVFLPVTYLIIREVNFSYVNYYQMIVHNNHQAQTLKYFFGIQLGAFNLLWFLFFLGLYKTLRDKNKIPLLSFLFIGILCPFWVSYEVRYFLVQYLGVIIFALIGFDFIDQKYLIKHGTNGKIIKILIASSPILVSLAAFLLIRGTSFWKMAFH